jgi:hypothetical protein
MSSPNTIDLAVKTLDLASCKTRNKVWLVSLDPKFSRPFVKGKVINDSLKNDSFYKVECTLKDQLSKKVIPHGLDRACLTRNDERVVTITVHEARMLQMSLNAMNAVGIGYTSFTQ